MIDLQKRKKNASLKDDAFDPISLNIVNKNEWIEEDNDNIKIMYKKKSFCMKRSFFKSNKLFPFAFLESCVFDKCKNNDNVFYLDLEILGIENSGVMLVEDLDKFQFETRRVFIISDSNIIIDSITSMMVNNFDLKQPYLHDLNLQFTDSEREYIVNYTHHHSYSINYYLRGEMNYDSEYGKKALTKLVTKKHDVKNHIVNIYNIIFKYGSISRTPIVLYKSTHEIRRNNLDYRKHLFLLQLIKMYLQNSQIIHAVYITLLSVLVFHFYRWKGSRCN